MSLTKITYTKDWTNPSDFPTVATSESVVRDDMQNLYNQIKDGVNFIVDEIDANQASATATTSSETATVSVNIDIYKTKISASGISTFTYYASSSSWKLNGTVVTLSDYGITFSGTPANGDTITVKYIASAGASNLNIKSISGVTGVTVQDAMEDLKSQIDTKASTASLTAHTSNTSNPHSVTKAQVGLGNADNTSDANKPISTATQSALDLKESIASADNLISNVTFSSADGKFTFTKQGGSTIIVDTNLEKVPGSMALVEDPVGSGTYYLVIYDTSTPPIELSRCPVTSLFNAIQVEDTSTIHLVLATGTEGKKKLTANVIDTSVTWSKLASDVTTRITTLESSAIKTATDTDTIDFTVSGTDITGFVKDQSITSNKLASGLYSEIQGFATRAETAATNASASESNASTYATNASNSATAASGSATSASGSASAASTSESNASTYAGNASNSATASSVKALVSEGWAVGTQNGVEVESTSPYYHNNSKYYKEQASAIVGGVYVTEVNGVTPGTTSGPVTIDADDIGTTGTTNQFTNATEKATWNAKQDALTFDNTPTSGSTNPVTSGGVYTALSGKVDIDSSSTESFTVGYDSGGLYIVTD